MSYNENIAVGYSGISSPGTSEGHSISSNEGKNLYYKFTEDEKGPCIIIEPPNSTFPIKLRVPKGMDEVTFVFDDEGIFEVEFE